MKELAELRDEIRLIDEEMAELFMRRMESVRGVAEYKRAHGLAVSDPAQEQRVIEGRSALISDEEVKPYYIQFLHDLMDVSKLYQHKLLEGRRIAYVPHKDKTAGKEPLMKYRYFLFDLDGTLTDPGVGITNSVMHALSKYGIEVDDRSSLYPFIGPPLTDSFSRYFGFSEEQALEAVDHYREYFRDKGLFENEVYEGIPEMLGELKQRGAVIALATSKPYEFSVRILEHFGLHQYFDHIGAATMDGSISRKADVIEHLLSGLGSIDRSSVIMIGDRDQDINGARANGLTSLGVLWGYGSEEELKGAGADFLASAPEDIIQFTED